MPVADAYRQELRADAARTRRKRPGVGGRRTAPRVAALRQTAGLVLIGIGTRLIGAGTTAAERAPQRRPLDARAGARALSAAA